MFDELVGSSRIETRKCVRTSMNDTVLDLVQNKLFSSFLPQSSFSHESNRKNNLRFE